MGSKRSESILSSFRFVGLDVCFVVCRFCFFHFLHGRSFIVLLWRLVSRGSLAQRANVHKPERMEAVSLVVPVTRRRGVPRTAKTQDHERQEDANSNERDFSSPCLRPDARTSRTFEAFVGCAVASCAALETVQARTCNAFCKQFA